MLLNFLIFQYWSWWYCCRLFVCFFSRFYDLYLFAFGSCYFWLKSANTCTNSILKTRCYSEVNILSTFFTNLAVTTSNIWALFGSSKVFEVAIGNMSIHLDSIASTVRRISLVDNVNINQDGMTSATFDMNDKAEVKENSE